MRAGNSEGLGAIGGGEEFVAMHGEARLEDIHVHGLVIHDEDTRRGSHGLLLGCHMCIPGDIRAPWLAEHAG